MTDPKALREKLEAMYAEKWRSYAGSEPRVGAWPMSVTRAVALDLLARLDAAEAPCVWSEEETTSHPKPYKTACHQRYIWPSKFCPGCGHPVQVKQPQDAAEEE